MTPRKLELRRIHGGWVWLRSVAASVGAEGTRAVRMITCHKSVHCGQRGDAGTDSQDTGGWVEA